MQPITPKAQRTDLLLQIFDAALAGLEASGALVCTTDHLNPCWDNRPDDIPGRHWGGGRACACCNARAALAAGRDE